MLCSRCIPTAIVFRPSLLNILLHFRFSHEATSNSTFYLELFSFHICFLSLNLTSSILGKLISAFLTWWPEALLYLICKLGQVFNLVHWASWEMCRGSTAHLNFPNPSVALEGKMKWCWSIRCKRVFNLMCILPFTWATANMDYFAILKAGL